MIENEFSENQLTAVESLDGNLLISASAGSGKTRVLVGRVINILEKQRAKINELLVVTFTEAAGEEMKDRIRQKLIKNGMYNQADEMSNSDIMNLHKFCNKLLRQYFYVVGLDPNYKVLDDVESEYIMLDVLDNCLNEYSAKDEYYHVLEAFYSSRRDESIKNVIIGIYKFLLSIDDGKSWLQEKFTQNYEVDFEQNLCLNYIRESIINLINDCKLALNAIQNAYKGELDDATISLIEDYKRLFDGFINFDSIKNTFDFINSTAVSYPKINMAKYDGANLSCRQQVKLIKESFTKYLTKFKNKAVFDSYDIWQKTIQQNGSFIKKLMDIVLDFSNKYAIAKQQKNCVDFADLEEKTLQILQNDEIREQLQNKYKYIFIDEYQDTNDVQEKIISLLTTGDNLFMVGDVKQSIYAFRGCSPQIFINKINNSQKSNKKDTLISLNKNFRSRNDILQFSNFVFEKIMTEKTAQVDYKNTSLLVYGEKYKSYSEKAIPSVEVIAFEKKQDQLKQMPKQYDLFEDELVVDEESGLDEQINKCLEIIKKSLDEKIYDETIDNYRKVEYGDIAILSRYNNVVSKVAKSLKLHSIPYASTYNTNLYSTYIIDLLINYFKLLDNDFQDIPLVAVLKSFMYNITNEELVKIKELDRKEKNFFASVQKYKTENNDTLSNKLNDFYQTLDEFRQKVEFCTIRELAESVINTFNFENYCAHLDDGIENLENINLFLDTVSSSNHSLSEFLNYVQEFAVNKSIDNTVKMSGNSVSVMTIHKSKGLEFPIVILVDCGKQIRNLDKTKQLVMEKNLGFATKYYSIEEHQTNELLLDTAIKQKITTNIFEEEMRLLYVALTRAKNNLFVLGEIDQKNISSIINELNVKQKNSYLQWILGALEDNDISSLLTNNSITKIRDGCIFKFCFCGYDDFVLTNQAIKTKPIRNVDMSQIMPYLEYIPPQEETLLKNTVTRLQTQEGEFAQINSSNTTINNQEIDYLTIGTVYHKVLEILDFECTEMSLIDTKYHEILTSNIFTEEEKQLLEKDKIITAVCKLKTLINQGDKVYKEQGFYYQTNMAEIGKSNDISNFLIQGVVDLMIVKKDGIVLVDYKTSRIANRKELAKKYQLQLDLYARSLEEFFGKKVINKFIYSFYLDDLINV